MKIKLVSFFIMMIVALLFALLGGILCIVNGIDQNVKVVIWIGITLIVEVIVVGIWGIVKLKKIL